jgi:hypothetical protein
MLACHNSSMLSCASATAYQIGERCQEVWPSSRAGHAGRQSARVSHNVPLRIAIDGVLKAVESLSMRACASRAARLSVWGSASSHLPSRTPARSGHPVRHHR